MKKIVAVAFILLAIVITPYITGKFIKNKFEQKIALLNNKLETFFHKKDLIKLDYQSGWFSSSAKTTINNVVINHHIIHGPYCTFGIAKIESRFEFSEKTEEDLNDLFEGKMPYSITTQLGFSGTTHFNISSPSIGEKTLPNSPNTKIDWQGLNYSATFMKETVSSSLEMPKLLVEDKSGSFLIDNINSQGTTSRLLDKELSLVIPKNIKLEGMSNIGKIAFKINDEKKPTDIQINNITTQLKSNDSDFSSSFTIDNITSTSGLASFSTDKINVNYTITDPLWILRNNLSQANWNFFSTTLLKSLNYNNPPEAIHLILDFYQEQQLTDNKDKIGFRELYKASNINLQSPNDDGFLNNIELSYQIEGLPKKPLARLLTDYTILIKKIVLTGFNAAINRRDVQTFTDNYIAISQQNIKVISSGQDFVIAVLQNTPDILVNAKLQGNRGDANFEFNASLIEPDATSSDISNLMMRTPARINAKLSINVAESFIDAVSKSAHITHEQLEALKQQMMQRFPITTNDGNYTLSLEFKKSMFYVNGQPDPDFLQKYSQRF